MAKLAVHLRSIEWWWKYLEVLISPREVFRTFHDLKPKIYDVSLPFLLLMISLFSLNLWIYSNPTLMERFMAADDAYYKTTSEIEIAEANRRAVEIAMNFPGAALVVASEVGISSARSIAVFLLLSYIAVSVLSRKWHLYVDFLTVSSLTSIVLLLGGLFNCATRVFFGRLSPLLSIEFFIRPADDMRFADYIFTRSDLFSLWYIGIFAYGISRLYEKNASYVIVLMFFCWLLLLSLSYFARFGFGFGI